MFTNIDLHVAPHRNDQLLFIQKYPLDVTTFEYTSKNRYTCSLFSKSSLRIWQIVTFYLEFWIVGGSVLAGISLSNNLVCKPESASGAALVEDVTPSARVRPLPGNLCSIK